MSPEIWPPSVFTKGACPLTVIDCRIELTCSTRFWRTICPARTLIPVILADSKPSFVTSIS